MAICYNPTKIRFTNLPVNTSKKTEVVCAVGSTCLSKRKIIAMSVYLPPNLTTNELDMAVNSMVECLNKAVTKYSDPILIVGGDFNKKDITGLLCAFSCLRPSLAGPTRRGEALDEIYTNIDRKIASKQIQCPLSRPNGIDSDHAVIAVNFKLPKQKVPVKTRISFRPITEDGCEMFSSLLLATDWTIIEKDSSSSSAEALNDLLDYYVKTCFPEKTRTISSNDAPWLDNKSKRLVLKKMKIYKREGKSERYYSVCREADEAIKAAKTKFFANIIEHTKQTRNSGKYYGTVKKLGTKEATPPWQVQSMYPGKTDKFISTDLAIFFNRISQEYVPLPNPSRVIRREDWTKFLEPFEVSARLKSFRKPKSRVLGDIDPKLVTRFHDVLALPLSFIFNQTLNNLSWPDLWKSETVHIIPKNNSPSSPAELRTCPARRYFPKF